ncbi:hypothetical protein HK414_12960 [Ramlibacter terrae]|uniref:Uncharacterized protein n=1 Tax=Ramlibacter terrae TaxID=2732511 RepID=A0ABX6P2S3_9BURK|nr:hypothetical protein HK414_12960 [Ramlibacter terrae]
MFAFRALLDRATEQTPDYVINWMRALLTPAENECGPVCLGRAEGEQAGKVYAAIRQLRQALPAVEGHKPA